MRIVRQVSRTVNNVSVLELNGRFDTHTALELFTWLDSVTECQPARVVVNLSGVSFVDSVALSALVSSLKRCRSGNGDLYLCCLPQRLQNIFELTRLNRVFTMFDEESVAIATLISQTDG
jgi:anti-sigma B factor antagonist